MPHHICIIFIIFSYYQSFLCMSFTKFYFVLYCFLYWSLFCFFLHRLISRIFSSVHPFFQYFLQCLKVRQDNIISIDVSQFIIVLCLKLIIRSYCLRDLYFISKNKSLTKNTYFREKKSIILFQLAACVQEKNRKSKRLNNTCA